MFSFLSSAPNVHGIQFNQLERKKNMAEDIKIYEDEIKEVIWILAVLLTSYWEYVSTYIDILRCPAIWLDF